MQWIVVFCPETVEHIQLAYNEANLELVRQASAERKATLDWWAAHKDVQNTSELSAEDLESMPECPNLDKLYSSDMFAPESPLDNCCFVQLP